MKLNFFIVLLFLIKTSDEICAQSFAPAPENTGTTAIFKDSSVFINWASGINLERGYLNISNKSLGSASFGVPENAINKAEGNSFDIVSLGDSGVAVLTFEFPIKNGNGPDFAVFENGFQNNYVEYAFVEVSSDGQNFVRFPAISETPTDIQMGNFEFSDCRYVNNLAGKYRQGFGTPFDLEELKDSAKINVNAITHVKIIDVIGSIDSNYASKDSQGNIINDPWPSEFDSGGFDLDGVGVIHQNSSGLEEKTELIKIFDFENKIVVYFPIEVEYEIYSLDGKLIVKNENLNSELTLNKRSSQEISFLRIIINGSLFTYKFFY